MSAPPRVSKLLAPLAPSLVGRQDRLGGGCGRLTFPGISKLLGPHGAVGDGDGLTLQLTTHYFVTHCTFKQCGDGQLDQTHACDFGTVSWCKFFYTSDTGHNFVNLILVLLVATVVVGTIAALVFASGAYPVAR